jgi:hypothetical protein
MLHCLAQCTQARGVKTFFKLSIVHIDESIALNVPDTEVPFSLFILIGVKGSLIYPFLPPISTRL